MVTFQNLIKEDHFKVGYTWQGSTISQHYRLSFTWCLRWSEGSQSCSTSEIQFDTCRRLLTPQTCLEVFGARVLAMPWLLSWMGSCCYIITASNTVQILLSSAWRSILEHIWSMGSALIYGIPCAAINNLQQSEKKKKNVKKKKVYFSFDFPG